MQETIGMITLRINLTYNEQLCGINILGLRQNPVILFMKRVNDSAGSIDNGVNMNI
jgi:hypothetical protein